jgi:hypothetical protein
MRAISPIDLMTAALLGSGFFIGFRLYGNGIWIVAAMLALMMIGQAALLRATQGNVLDQSIGPRARAVVTRNLFPFLFAVGLWLNAFAPKWYTQGNAYVTFAFGFAAMLATAVFDAIVSTVYARVRKRTR